MCACRAAPRANVAATGRDSVAAAVCEIKLPSTWDGSASYDRYVKSAVIKMPIAYIGKILGGYTYFMDGVLVGTFSTQTIHA